MTISERAQHAAAQLRVKNLVPSTRLKEVALWIAISLEETEWRGIKELETRLEEAEAKVAALELQHKRLEAAEAVCRAVEQMTATAVAHISVRAAVREWQKVKGA